MFEADQIYNTGINFVHKSIDPNFNVSDNQFDDSYGRSFLVLSSIVNKPHHFSDMNSLEFDDDDNYSTNNQENEDPNSEVSNTEKTVQNSEYVHSIIYKVKEIPQIYKTIFQFFVDNKLVLTAKRKNNLIVIGKGSTIHLNKDRSSHVAQITTGNGINIVNCENQNFRVNYVYLTGPKSFSMDVEFTTLGRKLHWKPKMPKFNNATNTYTLPLGGEYHRKSIKSNANTVLVNDHGERCMIVRKTNELEFEIDCNPRVPQAIIFALAISQIIGPGLSYTNIIRM